MEGLDFLLSSPFLPPHRHDNTSSVPLSYQIQNQTTYHIISSLSLFYFLSFKYLFWCVYSCFRNNKHAKKRSELQVRKKQVYSIASLHNRCCNRIIQSQATMLTTFTAKDTRTEHTNKLHNQLIMQSPSIFMTMFQTFLAPSHSYK